MKWLPTLALAALTTAYAASAKADDVFKGMRGPTNWQIDLRAAHAESGNARSNTGNAILKYWDGDERGKWCFLNVPYRAAQTPAGRSDGFGDVTAGCGPRGRIGNFHFLSYAGATFPTGNTESIGGRAGAFGTYLTGDKRHDLDFSVERAWAEGAPDTITGGLLFGNRVGERFRLGVGATGRRLDNGEYAAGARGVLRYTRSPAMHIELICDQTLHTRGLPDSYSVTLLGRWSFGKRVK